MDWAKFDFAEIDAVNVAPHKDGTHATVSFSVEETRIQLIVELDSLPTEFQRAGNYYRRNGKWTRVVRVDGEQAAKALKALFNA